MPGGGERRQKKKRQLFAKDKLDKRYKWSERIYLIIYIHVRSHKKGKKETVRGSAASEFNQQLILVWSIWTMTTFPEERTAHECSGCHYLSFSGKTMLQRSASAAQSIPSSSSLIMTFLRDISSSHFTNLMILHQSGSEATSPKWRVAPWFSLHEQTWPSLSVFSI